MSGLFAPLLYVASGFLLISGVTKLRTPAPASSALRNASLPSAYFFVRLIGAAESAVGTLCLVNPSRTTSFALAGFYLSFAGFLTYLLKAKPEVQSCGCMGSREVPPSRLHIGLNVFGGLVGVCAGVFHAPPLWSVVQADLPASPALLLGCLGLGYFFWVAINDLPAAWTSYSRASVPIRRPLTARQRAEREEAGLRAAGLLPGDPSLYPGRPDLAEEARRALLASNDRTTGPGSPAAMSQAKEES